MNITELMELSEDNDNQAAFNILYGKEIFGGKPPIDAEIYAQLKLGIIENHISNLAF